MHPRSTSDRTSPERERHHTPELEEQIRRRAYQLFEQRGRIEGHDVDDWLQAEAKLTAKTRTPVA
jgi:hypothetical protein